MGGRVIRWEIGEICAPAFCLDNLVVETQDFSLSFCAHGVVIIDRWC